MIVLNDNDIIANAFYAKQAESLEYSEINDYKILLYQTIIKKHKYVKFEHSESNVINIEGHIFIKENDVITSLNKVDEEFIKSVNSIYPKDIQEMIIESREKYIEKPKKLVKEM